MIAVLDAAARLDVMKSDFRRLTDATADWHHQQAEIDDLRALLVVADPVWLAAYEADLEAENAEFDVLYPDVAGIIEAMLADPV